jgi:hypothetical protein
MLDCVNHYSQELVGVSLGFVYSSSYVRINLDFPSSGLWRGLVVDEEKEKEQKEAKRSLSAIGYQRR